jgi:non-heme chloroperoxidase
VKYRTKYCKKIIVLAFLLNCLLSLCLIPIKSGFATTLTTNMVEKSFTTSDGIKLTYLIGGQGNPSLVFIPGWLMPADVFNAQLNYFSKDYQVISLNPRSQGTSDIYLGKDLAAARSRDIKELITHLKLNDFVLIGWSLGVMESLDYVQRYGTKGLKSLVLIDNSIGEGTPPLAKASSKKGKSSVMDQKKFTSYVKGFVKAIFKSDPPEEFTNKVEQSALRLSQTPQNAFNILSKPYPREYYKNTIYETNVPIWYAITPRYLQQGMLFSEKHPQGAMTIYDNAGHALFVDVADDFNRDLENFLRNNH